MNENRPRPFYGEYAWAYDLLIDRPVRKECAAVETWLVERGISPGAELLDAGCGTGRYSAELARRGYVVHGIDVSPELIDAAKQLTSAGPLSVTFAVGNLLNMTPRRYDALLCRGVLNEIVADNARDMVFNALSDALRPGGALIIDVREWEASAERKAREPLFKKRVATNRGDLTFTSVTELDPKNRQLLVSERHALVVDGQERTTDYRFVMRCWTRDELQSTLARCGFNDVAYFGAYDTGVEVGATDRLVAVARVSRSAA